MKVVPFETWHYESLTAQKGREYLRAYITTDMARAWDGSDQVFTAMDGDTVLCCAGVVNYWGNRGEAFAFLSPAAGEYALKITRAVRRYLDICPVRRVEAAVEVGFEEGRRWAESVGFKLASPWPMKAYKPDGTDCWLYARVA